jgi:hypothetical protein
MADSPEPKKETVRIPASPQPLDSERSSRSQSHEKVRIHLPTRSRANLSPPSDLPSPIRGAIPSPTTKNASENDAACIKLLPEAPARSSVEPKKMEPLMDLPVECPTTKLTAGPQLVARVNEIPMRLCWALLATSAAVLILQIWNYLS